MIQIDMPMPTNCLNCPACNEYLKCAIPINGRKCGENDVCEFEQTRPEWCPMKEQEAVKPRKIDGKRNHFIKCGNCNYDILTGFRFCPHCGREVKWK